MESPGIPGRFTSTAELIDKLTADKEARWAEYSKGKPISPRQVSRLLGSFGIVSSSIRLDDDKTPKGFKLESCQDAFTRYIPGSNPPQRHKPIQARVVALWRIEVVYWRMRRSCNGRARPPRKNHSGRTDRGSGRR